MPLIKNVRNPPFFESVKIKHVLEVSRTTFDFYIFQYRINCRNLLWKVKICNTLKKCVVLLTSTGIVKNWLLKRDETHFFLTQQIYIKFNTNDSLQLKKFKFKSGSALLYPIDQELGSLVMYRLYSILAYRVILVKNVYFT